MATFKITDPNTGKTLRVTGDSPPTESELNDIFSSQQPKQDLLSAWGFQPTKQQMETQPYQSAAAKTINEGAVIPALHFLNVAGFNLPRATAESVGYKYPEAESEPGKILSHTAGAMGLPFSPIGAAIGGIAGVGRGVLGKTTTGALGGALGGAAWVDPKETLQKVGKRAAVGAAIGGAVGLGSGIMNKFTQQGDNADFAEKVQKEFVQSKVNAVNEFGDDIDRLSNQNPDRTISLREQVIAINNDPYMSAEAQSVFRKTPILRDMLDNPDLANNVSLKDAQEIANYLNTKVPKTVKYNHLDILDMASDIKAKQLDAFPELQETRDAYSGFKQSYDALKSQMKYGKTLDAIGKNFGDAQMQKASKKIFSSDMLEQMQKYRHSLKLLQLMGFLGKHSAVGVASVIGGATGAMGARAVEKVLK